MLIKTLPLPLAKPFVEAGYVRRELLSTIYAPTIASQGFAIGGGIQFGIGRLHLAPAVRYTHWTNSPYLVVFPNGPTLWVSQNQTDLLMGISWKIK